MESPMTAQVTMLTDEEIEKAAIKFSDAEGYGFEVDARYIFKQGAFSARDRYEARLAEDAKVRAQLVEALEAALATLSDDRIGTCDYMEGSRIYTDFEDCAVGIRAALAAAKERG